MQPRAPPLRVFFCAAPSCLRVRRRQSDGLSWRCVCGVCCSQRIGALDEELKLNFIKEIGFCHMRILDGLDSLLQLSGLIGKLCCNAGVVRK